MNMVDGVPEYSYYESVEQPDDEVEVEQPDSGAEFEHPEYEEGVVYPLDPNDPAAMPEEDIPYVPPVYNPVPDPPNYDPPPPYEPDPDFIDGP
jgi:hypothetical protein